MINDDFEINYIEREPPTPPLNRNNCKNNCKNKKSNENDFINDFVNYLHNKGLLLDFGLLFLIFIVIILEIYSTQININKI